MAFDYSGLAWVYFLTIQGGVLKYCIAAREAFEQHLIFNSEKIQKWN